MCFADEFPSQDDLTSITAPAKQRNTNTPAMAFPIPLIFYGTGGGDSEWDPDSVLIAGTATSSSSTAYPNIRKSRRLSYHRVTPSPKSCRNTSSPCMTCLLTSMPGETVFSWRAAVRVSVLGTAKTPRKISSSSPFSSIVHVWCLSPLPCTRQAQAQGAHQTAMVSLVIGSTSGLLPEVAASLWRLLDPHSAPEVPVRRSNSARTSAAIMPSCRPISWLCSPDDAFTSPAVVSPERFHGGCPRTCGEAKGFVGASVHTWPCRAAGSE